jgi:hypothetical protein
VLLKARPVTPTRKPKTNTFRTQVQGRADIHKGKWPARIVLKEPFFGFLRKALLTLAARNELMLKTFQGILKNRAH